jgi:ribonuclease HI
MAPLHIPTPAQIAHRIKPLTATPPTYPEPRTPAPAPAPATPPRRLTIATDGSRGYGPQSSKSVRTSWAWITDTGEHGTGITGKHAKTGILYAEIVAVSEAINATPPTQPLLLLIDNKEACRILSAINRDGAIPPLSAEAAKAHGPLVKILQRMTMQDIEVRWVRGHSGHPLNDAADRLAVLTRRAAQSDLDDEAVTVLRERILADVAAAYPQAA